MLTPYPMRLAIYLLLICCTLGPFSVFCQGPMSLPLARVSAGDFDLPKSSLIDSNTNAVIMADIGKTSFVGNKQYNWVSYVYKRNIRIKIINKKAFDLATIRIMLHANAKNSEVLDSLQASTYNLENGKVVESKMSLNDVFRDTINKSHIQTKFTLPSLKEGCIIEYSFILTSYRYWNLPSWSFQHRNYPCLYSQYVTEIPKMLGYLVLNQGQDRFSVDSTEKTKVRYRMASVDVVSEMLRHSWVMKDIPSFREEPFLEHPYNYVDKVEFVLLQTYNGNSISGNITWSGATKELLESEEFGAALTEDGSSNLSNAVQKICGADFDYMTAARHIYSYIRDNFACEPDDDIYLGNDLYKVNRRKKGSVEELNLLLVAMLRQKNINASPVILSTAEYGTNAASYPVLGKMNYVVCMMKMALDTIFLDASQPLLGFGQLPLKCYNGHARIISDHDSGSIFLNRDDLKESKVTTVFLLNDEKTRGRLTGKLETVPGPFESYDIRKEIAGSSENAFFDDIRKSYDLNMRIDNPGIDSLKRLEDPVKIHYDLSFVPEENGNFFYLNPVISSAYKVNPFKAGNRRYPVDMPFPVNELYNFSFQIPEGFAVEELPKSARVAYNGNEGMFEYLIQKTESFVQLRVRLKLNKAEFAAEDYDSLRDFFGFVAKQLNEQITFRKKP